MTKQLQEKKGEQGLLLNPVHLFNFHTETQM